MIAREQIALCTDILRKAYNPSAIYLFGSYAWGTPTDDSDLDYLIVLKDSTVPVVRRSQIGETALMNARISVPTDLIVTTEHEFSRRVPIQSELYHKIYHEGVLV